MNKHLLDRFYEGKCSPEELQQVLTWFQSNEITPEQELDLNFVWQEAEQTDIPINHSHDPKKLFLKLKEQLKETTDSDDCAPDEHQALVIKLHQPLFWLKAVAAVLLPLCLVWAFIAYTSTLKTKSPTIVSVTTKPGIRKTIKLADGSTIILNAGSKITYPKDFTPHTREIKLWGEAFFEVAKDSLRPFIVHTGNISTKALGTSFNINYSQENNLAIALATGLVEITKEKPELNKRMSLLIPGQQLYYDHHSDKYQVASYNRTEVLGWQQGILYFKKADMKQIVRKLENWYGVTIEVDTYGEKDTSWNYTGEYHNETLDKVLEGIGFVKDFTHQETNGKVIIKFN
ncbi:FecR family protein [Pontibacter sp. SGAir0037]|uniref:FecR family protein n=1 Tax=Pontibacter sp. SGAir0037 TaxID=2571030 RepID=UPI0010CD3C65|nr:FecR family protein [Pontibacter sp. SGAir0037]QCR22738.1 hypothetical protein C1N53_10535 [Pontibacter sp. SGAir0037]